MSTQLNGIVGAKSNNVAGWDIDVLKSLATHQSGDVWNNCGQDGAWFGWKLNAYVGSVSTTLTTSGRAEMSFGNCWHKGTVMVYLNENVIATAGPNSHKLVTFDFQVGDVLKLRDKGANSIIQINSFNILQCGHK